VNPRSRPLLVVSLLLAVLVCPSVLADDEQKAAEQTAMERELFRAWLDATDLGKMLQRNTSDLFVTRTRDGMTFDPDGGFRNVLVVKIGADGKPVISCIVSVEQAAAIFERPKTPQVEKEP